MIGRLSFRQQQFFVLLILALVPLIFTLGIALPIIQNFVIQRTRIQLEIIADIRTTQVNNWIDDGRDVARLISDRILHEVALHKLSFDVFQNEESLLILQDDLVNVLESTLLVFGEIQAISILHPDNGDIIFSTDATLVGRKRGGEDFFIFGREELFINPVVYSVGHEAPILAIAVPIKNEQDELLAVVEVEMNLSQIDDILANRTGLGETGHAYLIENYGFYVTQSPYQANGILRTIAESNGANEALAGSNGYGIYSAPSGESVLGVYRWLPEVNLGLLVEIEQAEMTAQYRYIWLVLTVAEIILLGISIIIARILADRLVHPLEQIVEVTRSLRAGNLNRRTVAEGAEEIRLLALAFNEMADDLQSSYKNLEGLVQERTAELLASNVQLRQEIVEREQAQDALSVSENRYRSVFENAQVPLWEQDFSALKIHFEELREQGISNFQAYFDEYPEAISYCASILKIIDINPAGLKLYKAKHKSELQYDSSREMHPENRQVILMMFVALAEGHYSFEDEGIVRTLDGETHHVILRFSVAPDYEDTWSRIFMTINDITKLKQIELALRDSEEWYRQISELMSDNASSRKYDPVTGQYVLENFIGKIISGHTIDDFKVLAPNEHYHPDDIDKALAQIAAVQRGEASELEYRLVTKEGDIRWVYGKLQPVWDEKHERVIRYFAVTQDITERKLAEEALLSERNLLRTFIDNIPDYIFVKDSEGRFVISNTAHANGANLKPSELIGKTAFDIYLEHLAAQFSSDDDKILRLGKTLINSERIILDAAGQPMWVLTTKIPLYDEKGEISGLVGISRDITERKQTEEALRISERRYRAVFENVPIVLMEQDFSALKVYLDGLKTEGVTDFGQYFDEHPKEVNHCARLVTISDANQAALKFYRIDDKMKISTHLIKRFEHGANPILRGQLIALAEGQLHLVRNDKTFSFEGEERHIIYQLSIAPDYEETWSQVLISVSDITALKQAEQALLKINENLEQLVIERSKELATALEDVRRFAYIVSHDLRAPLVNITGFTNELQIAMEQSKPIIDAILPQLDESARQQLTFAFEEDIPESLEFIDSSAKHMSRLIDALLKLSRIGSSRLEPELIDIDEQVRESLQSLAHQISSKNIQVDYHSLPKIWVDRIAISQIMGNLLNNAVNYLEPSRRGEIEISAEQNHEVTTFYIRDNGRGIAIEDHAKIFELFRRAGDPIVKGDGMGLTYVHTLIRRHGGNIRVESELGVGTTFIFTIPRHIDKASLDDSIMGGVSDTNSIY